MQTDICFPENTVYHLACSHGRTNVVKLVLANAQQSISQEQSFTMGLFFMKPSQFFTTAQQLKV